MYGEEFIGEPIGAKQCTLDGFSLEKEVIENYRLTTLICIFFFYPCYK